MELLQACGGRRVPAVVGKWLQTRGLLNEAGRRRMRRTKEEEEEKIWTSAGEKAMATRTVGVELAMTSANMPRRETRCQDCWCFPVRRKGVKVEAVYEALGLEFWCVPCQELRQRAMQKGEKVRGRTSMGWRWRHHHQADWR